MSWLLFARIMQLYSWCSVFGFKFASLFTTRWLMWWFYIKLGCEFQMEIVNTPSPLKKMLFTPNSQVVGTFIVLWQLSGWYNRLQRDDVVAEWKKVKDKMSLHVHCHVSGAHLLLDLAAEFRYHIFTKELPLVSLYKIGRCRIIFLWYNANGLHKI